MPYISAYMHYIWATKNRIPLITKNLKPILLEHIRENAVKKDIFIDTLNCVEDHIHLLISMNAELSIAKVANLIKGESSFWVNKQKLIQTKFEWQDDYISLSANNGSLDKLRKYIYNQEEHHKKITSKQEYDMYIKKIEKMKNNSENNFLNKLRKD
jgi:putative transposase